MDRSTAATLSTYNTQIQLSRLQKIYQSQRGKFSLGTGVFADRCAVTATGSRESIKRLIKIGEEREHGLKDYLIEEGDIESSRILFCKPQIDSTKGATPRITISV
jgi:hypothetical protein